MYCAYCTHVLVCFHCPVAGVQGTASDVKFVDGAKPIFKVSLKLCSSVYTKVGS